MREHETDYRPQRGNGDARGDGERSPQKLQQDIQRHRDNLDRTLSALGNKLSPGELLDEGLRYMKSGPGEFFASLAQTAKHNPLPMVLTGVGLAWLMLGQRNAGNSHTGTSGPTGAAPSQHDQDDVTGLYAEYLVQEYPFAADEVDCIIYDELGAQAFDTYRTRTKGGAGLRAKGQWKGQVGAATDRAGNKASDWSDSVRSGAARVSEETRARIDSARERMAARSAEVRERTRRAREIAWHRAQQAKSAATAQARRAIDATSDIVQRYPLSMIAVGVAAGAALGTALPETGREDRIMGEAGDAIKAQARSALNRQVQRARQVATAARDATMDEARAQGLSADGVRQEIGELRDKADKVAGAARDEAERQGFTPEGAHEELDRAREKVERVAAAARDAARAEDERNR